MNRVLYFLLTFASATLTVLSFPPWDLSPGIFFALLPFLWAVRRAESRRLAFYLSLTFAWLMTVGGFFWIHHSLYQYGGIPLPLAWLGVALYGLIGQMQFYVFGPLLNSFYSAFHSPTNGKANRVPLLLQAPLLGFTYAAIDWLNPKLFTDTLGYATHNLAWLRAWAQVGGPYLITAVLMTLNLWLLQALEGWIGSRRTRTPYRLNLIATWAIGLLAFVVGGAALHHRARTAVENAKSTVPVSMIQANVGDLEKLASESGVGAAADRVIRQYLHLSDEALQKYPQTQIVTWPETAYPSLFGRPSTRGEFEREAMVRKWALQWGKPLLFGGYDSKGEKDFNSLFFLWPKPSAPTELETGVYHKHILLLFGEYIPFTENWDWFKRTFPQVGNFGRGIGPTVTQVPTGTGRTVGVSPTICYEALFPWFSIESKRKGADFILNVTNDSWFGPIGEPDHHLAMSVFRSIESGLPQVRSTNTGYSALLLPDGRVLNKSRIFTPEVIYAEVPVLESYGTVLAALGDWFGTTVLALTAIAWYWVYRKATPRVS